MSGINVYVTPMVQVVQKGALVFNDLPNNIRSEKKFKTFS